jgi:MinD superfamily P-loop ATPase
VVEMPKVDLERCTGCGLCVSVCVCKALILVNNIVMVVETEKCGWCTECEAVCPVKAISCPFEIIIEPFRD